MEKDKKILLYQIDEQSKNVIFAVTSDTETEWSAISDDVRTVVSFDDIFKDITAFRENFLDYEQLTDELIGAINGRGEVFREILSRFDDMRLKSFNFFTRYYSDTLRDIFTSARYDIEKSGALFNTRVLKRSTEYVNSVFNEIREVMRDDWNFDFNSESGLQTMKVSYTKIIVRGNDRNEIYTVADTSLLNFFYDFSYSIHRLKLYVCKCKYCNNIFLGAKNSICCDSEDCKGKYLHEKKNEKRREYDNGDYQKYKTRLSNYIGQQKLKLSDKVKADTVVLKRFDQERKVYTKLMKDKIGVYQAENRLPDDELENFYKELTKRFARFWTGLVDEWTKEHCG